MEAYPNMTFCGFTSSEFGRPSGTGTMGNPIPIVEMVGCSRMFVWNHHKPSDWVIRAIPNPERISGLHHREYGNGGTPSGLGAFSNKVPQVETCSYSWGTPSGLKIDSFGNVKIAIVAFFAFVWTMALPLFSFASMAPTAMSGDHPKKTPESLAAAESKSATESKSPSESKLSSEPIHPYSESVSSQESEPSHSVPEEAKESEGSGIPEIPNIIQILYEIFNEEEKPAAPGEHPVVKPGEHPGEKPVGHPGERVAEKREGMAGVLHTLHKGNLKEPLPIVGTLPWENHVFAILGGLILIALFGLGVRRMSLKSPSRMQILVEMIVGGFDRFVCNILGPKHGRRFAPYIASLFLFILINNLMGIFPLMKSPTSSLMLTGSLAILTFIIVQVTALTQLGIGGYLFHLSGEPHSVIEWCLVPLFFLLHVIGELARPISLGLRLFGNILGEDILLGAFLVMGVTLAAVLGLKPPAPGIPLHFPFLFLVLRTSTIQALVFSLLTTIYILLVLPHDHDHEHGESVAAESHKASGEINTHPAAEKV